MFYAITYPVQTPMGANLHNVTLSDLSTESLTNVFIFLANGNLNGEWFVPRVSVHTMSGEYVGEWSHYAFEAQANGFHPHAMA